MGEYLGMKKNSLKINLLVALFSSFILCMPTFADENIISSVIISPVFLIVDLNKLQYHDIPVFYFSHLRFHDASFHTI